MKRKRSWKDTTSISQEFIAAMDDDLNTADAISAILN